MKKSVSLIVARSRNNVIGNKYGIPWKIKGEQSQFKMLTTGNAVIMGRRTFEDLKKPLGLPDRLNIVVSNTKEYQNDMTGLMTQKSLRAAIDAVPEDLDVYIVGGYGLYKEIIDADMVDRMYITEVGCDCPVDESTVYFPEFDKEKYDRTVGEIVDGPIPYTRTLYTRKWR